MAFIDMTFAFENELAALAGLSALEVTLSTASIDAWMRTEATSYIHDRARARFASEGDDVSGPWQALAPATVADREAHGFPGANPILHRTGALENYITNLGASVIPLGPEGVEMTMPGGSATGDSELALKYKTAQAGMGRVPARPVLGMNETDAEALTASLGITLEALLAGGL